MTSVAERGFYTFATIFLVIAALHLAEEVLVPISLSILLSFILGPIVSRVERVGTGRVIAVGLVSLVTFAALYGVGWIVTAQLSDLGTKAPEYREHMREKIKALKSASTGIFSELKETADELQSEIESVSKISVVESEAGNPQSQTPVVSPERGTASEAPIWTQTVPPPASPLEILRGMISPFLGPLATVGIVIVLTIFMLIYREDLRDRIIQLVGEDRVTTTTEAMDEAASRVGTFLLMQLIVNVTYGIPVGIGLYLIGVPYAVLWGVLATVLRFVPYIGPWIAAVFPIALSFAISESWAQPLYAIGIFVVLELVSNNIIEPLLYGKNTGVSPVAILVAAIFWTWVWGGVGLLLSTPLTVCLVVMGKYVPGLNFISTLFGDTPALEPKMRIYQRLLALDNEEARRTITELHKTNSLIWIFEEVLLGVLRLSEEDRHRGVIDDKKSETVCDGVRELIDEAVEIEQKAVSAEAKEIGNFPTTSASTAYCLPVHDTADELVGYMLEHLLRAKGVTLKLLSATNLTSEMVTTLVKENPPFIIISALPPAATNHTRYLLKRLTSAFTSLPIVVGFWDPQGNKEVIKERFSDGISVLTVLTLKEVVEMSSELASLSSKPEAIPDAAEKNGGRRKFSLVSPNPL